MPVGVRVFSNRAKTMTEAELELEGTTYKKLVSLHWNEGLGFLKGNAEARLAAKHRKERGDRIIKMVICGNIPIGTMFDLKFLLETL